jgi:hypothetical protein
MVAIADAVLAGWQTSSLVSATINIAIMLHFGETAKPILRRHI